MQNPESVNIPTNVREFTKSLDAAKVLADLSLDFSDDALGYLQDRFPGFDVAEVIHRAGLMYHKEREAIAIPTYNATGELIAVKYRLLKDYDGLRYVSEPGSVNGMYALKGPDPDRVLLVEGEFDALTAALLGFKGHIWALGSSALRKARIDELRKFKHIFLIPDNDGPGQEASKELSKLLGDHLQTVVLNARETKDLNDYLQIYGKANAEAFLNSSLITREEAHTQTFEQALKGTIEYLANKKESNGTPTGYKGLDRRLGGGLRPGELTVVNAYAKTGKSTFVNNLIFNLLKQDVPTALASFEMSPERAIAPVLMSMALNMNIRNLSDQDLKDLSEDLNSSPECARLQKLVFFKRFGTASYASLEAWIRYVNGAFNIRHVFIDHAAFLLRDPRDTQQNKAIAEPLSMLAKELAIHIFIVVQAPKLDRDIMHLGLNTLFGGAVWPQYLSNLITVERSKEHEDVAEVRLIAARDPSSRPTEEPILLVYDADTGRLVD